MAKLVIGENDLQSLCPELCEEWNYEKNHPLLPSHITTASARIVWWKCKKGHEWEASVNSRKKGQNCPFCANKRILRGFNDLATTHPQLLNEWNYEKNTEVSPYEISHGSKIVVWWICSNGHEWQSKVQNRASNRTRGCPICSEKNRRESYYENILISRGSLADTDAEICHLWNYEKNTDIQPFLVTSGSEEKVWWRCDKCEYEWMETIKDMVYRRRCPFCVGKKLFEGVNDLLTLRPDLAKEWNYRKNEGVLPSQVKASSNKKYWWICSVGHEWEATVNSRNQGRGCPRCNDERQTSFAEQAVFYYVKKYYEDAVSRDKSLGIEFDVFIPSVQVSIEYDGQFYHSNISRDIKKSQKAEALGVRLIRIREPNCPILNDSSYQIKLNDLSINDLSVAIEAVLLYLKEISNTSYIPQVDVGSDTIAIEALIEKSSKEKSIANLFPHLSEEWDFAHNGTLTPQNTPYGSTRKVWWICSKCGNQWQASPNSRTNASKKSGRACPLCAKKEQGVSFTKSIVEQRGSLQKNNPSLSAEWDYEDNAPLTPNDVTAHSHKKVWWLCKNKHKWQASIDSRSRGNGCPYCSQKRK